VGTVRQQSNALSCVGHTPQAAQFLQRVRAITTAKALDPDTENHERRVAKLAVAIGQAMGLSEHQIEGVHVAATVHDLGKTQIPAEIVRKPHSLDEAEFIVIKTHPLKGYHLLKDIGSPWPIAEIVLQHHERLDGSGYPNGLKGKCIRLEARIVAVADTVEAMVSHRAYKAGVGVEAALDEITAGSGKHYDSQVVAACVRLFREKGFSLLD
jgi:HD-GYP domain-containing protein (c-di-GMP phosphodiesterase class II)